jgi:PAS domain S-box-containing protein
MIAPRPVPERSVRRLRRRYAWLMLALAAPVLAASLYVLRLQYENVRVGLQRQLAMSADKSVTQLDAVLGRIREDLLRLGVAARTPGLPAHDLQVDKAALLPDARGMHTLDAMPALLRETAPQVVLTGPARADAARRDAAVEGAAVFAEQARLAMLRGGRFSRVAYVDVEAGEAWIVPWIPSAQWLGELAATDSPGEVMRSAARQAGLPEEALVPIEGEVRWRVRRDADGKGVVTLALPVPGASSLRFVAADVPLAALDDARMDIGMARFWVVDGDGQLVVDHGRLDLPPSIAMGGPPPVLARELVGATLDSPLAQEVGPVLVAARGSTVAPWTALHASDSAEVRRRVLADMLPYVAGGAALLALFLGIATFVWRHFGQPSLRLVDYLHRQAADPRAPEPKVPAEWEPWLHLTRDTFAAWRGAAAREERTEALKSAIVDHALAAVVTTDAQGLIVEFNPAAERMFARTREQMIGRPAGGTIVADSLRTAYVEDLRRLRRGEPPQILGRRVEFSALLPDGSELPVDMVLWRTQVGDETFVTASLYDLSERRAAREEIERQREALRQAEKLTALGSLLAGVAHELNNPLAIVMGRASLLEDKCTDPQLRADAARIREAADRCGRIVRTFLAMARRRPASRGQVQLNDLVLGAVDLLHYNLRTSGITLEPRLETALPMVLADADQLGQALLNLIVNAQQAVARMEPPRLVRIETGHDAAQVWLRVSDNGVGIAQASRERIFDAFVTTKAEGAGTGLGLAVSRSIAREHGGELRLERQSPFGRGASFRLELPLRAAETPAAPITPADGAHAPAAAQPAASATARVLVVDDEPELATFMRDALEATGYEVASAESGAVALALLEEGRFDAIVCDLRMPDMDGPALWRAVRTRHRGLARRFVFVTGDTLSPLANEFRNESGTEGLEKPFAALDLVQHVRRCLERAN